MMALQVHRHIITRNFYHPSGWKYRFFHSGIGSFNPLSSAAKKRALQLKPKHISMKKTSLFFLLLMPTLMALAQLNNTQLMDNLLQSMQNFEKQYLCIKTPAQKAKVVSNIAFDSAYFLASSRILTTSQDLVKNGKTASLDFNEPLKKLSISYSWKNDPLVKKGNIWTAGFSAEEASKKLFEIWGKKGWKEGFTFSLGQAIPVGKASLLFMPTPCAALKDKRILYYTQLLREYQEILQTPAPTIAALQARKTASNALTGPAFDALTNAAAATAIPLTEKEKKLLEQWEKLNALKTLPFAPANAQNLYEQSVADFEIANFKSFGFKVKWINWGITAGLKRFTIYDTAVVALAGLTKKSLPRFTASVSRNFFREAASNQSILYTALDASIGNTNYLEEILPAEIGVLKATAPGVEIKEEYDALVLKNYDALKKNYAFVSFGALINYFPGKIGKWEGRFLGFELAGNTKLKTFVPEGINARNLFTIKGGLLFTFEKEKAAKTTFGIIAALTDIPFNDLTIKDRFGIALRIGVPFNY